MRKLRIIALIFVILLVSSLFVPVSSANIVTEGVGWWADQAREEYNDHQEAYDRVVHNMARVSGADTILTTYNTVEGTMEEHTGVDFSEEAVEVGKVAFETSTGIDPDAIMNQDTTNNKITVSDGGIMKHYRFPIETKNQYPTETPVDTFYWMTEYSKEHNMGYPGITRERIGGDVNESQMPFGFMASNSDLPDGLAAYNAVKAYAIVNGHVTENDDGEEVIDYDSIESEDVHDFYNNTAAIQKRQILEQQGEELLTTNVNGEPVAKYFNNFIAKSDLYGNNDEARRQTYNRLQAHTTLISEEKVPDPEAYMSGGLNYPEYYVNVFNVRMLNDMLVYAVENEGEPGGEIDTVISVGSTFGSEYLDEINLYYSLEYRSDSYTSEFDSWNQGDWNNIGEEIVEEDIDESHAPPEDRTFLKDSSESFSWSSVETQGIQEAWMMFHSFEKGVEIDHFSREETGSSTKFKNTSYVIPEQGSIRVAADQVMSNDKNSTFATPAEVEDWNGACNDDNARSTKDYMAGITNTNSTISVWANPPEEGSGDGVKIGSSRESDLGEENFVKIDYDLSEYDGSVEKIRLVRTVRAEYSYSYDLKKIPPEQDENACYWDRETSQGYAQVQIRKDIRVDEHGGLNPEVEAYVDYGEGGEYFVNINQQGGYQKPAWSHIETSDGNPIVIGNWSYFSYHRHSFNSMQKWKMQGNGQAEKVRNHTKDELIIPISPIAAPTPRSVKDTEAGEFVSIEEKFSPITVSPAGCNYDRGCSWGTTSDLVERYVLNQYDGSNTERIEELESEIQNLANQYPSAEDDEQEEIESEIKEKSKELNSIIESIGDENGIGSLTVSSSEPKSFTVWSENGISEGESVSVYDGLGREYSVEPNHYISAKPAEFELEVVDSNDTTNTLMVDIIDPETNESIDTSADLPGVNTYVESGLFGGSETYELEGEFPVNVTVSRGSRITGNFYEAHYQVDTREMFNNLGPARTDEELLDVSSETLVDRDSLWAIISGLIMIVIIFLMLNHTYKRFLIMAGYSREEIRNKRAINFEKWIGNLGNFSGLGFISNIGNYLINIGLYITFMSPLGNLVSSDDDEEEDIDIESLSPEEIEDLSEEELSLYQQSKLEAVQKARDLKPDNDDDEEGMLGPLSTLKNNMVVKIGLYVWLIYSMVLSVFTGGTTIMVKIFMFVLWRVIIALTMLMIIGILLHLLGVGKASSAMLDLLYELLEVFLP